MRVLDHAQPHLGIGDELVGVAQLDERGLEVSDLDEILGRGQVIGGLLLGVRGTELVGGCQGRARVGQGRAGQEDQ